MAKTLIDFHAHIVPGADHGCLSAEEAGKQIAMLRDAGITSIVATPHFYPERVTVRRFLERRERGVRAMMEVMRSHDPKVYLGAEIMISRNLDQMPELDCLTICGTDTILVEFPSKGIDEALIDSIIRIKNSGFNVIIAHVDRYKAKYMEYLFGMGFRGQLNADAFLLKKIHIHSRLKKWVDSGYIVAVGSDLHGHSDKHIREIERMRKVLGEERLEKISENTEKVLGGAVPVDEF